jgi:hypothetical protein
MKTLFFFSTIFILTSCIKNNPEPSWIEISNWNLIENPEEEGLAGELTHNFKDAYISIDGNVIGFFELPVKLPLLLEGNVKILIYPVVRNNGISSTKKIYPFCSSYELKTNLVKNERLKINPTTHYVNNLEFWVEDFEDASFEITTHSESTAQLLKENLPPYLKYGNYYGAINLNTTDSTWIGSTIEFPNVPKAGAEVYLELDYMTGNKLLTAINANVDGTEKANPNVQLNSYDYESLGWKKIYIDLKEIVSSYSTATYFKHYFTATLDLGKTETHIYLDNIRFVYLK